MLVKACTETNFFSKLIRYIKSSRYLCLYRLLKDNYRYYHTALFAYYTLDCLNSMKLKLKKRAGAFFDRICY